MFIGNPFTDVPSLQTYSFVVTDNDFALAEREAIRIANSFWSNHEQMRVPLVSLEEMARIVKENAGGTLAIVAPLMQQVPELREIATRCCELYKARDIRIARFYRSSMHMR